MRKIIVIAIMSVVSLLMAQINQVWDIVNVRAVPHEANELFWSCESGSQASSPVVYRRVGSQGRKTEVVKISTGEILNLPETDSLFSVNNSFLSNTKTIFTSYMKKSSNGTVDAYEIRNFAGELVGRHEIIPKDFILLSTGLPDGRIFGYTKGNNSFVMFMPDSGTPKVVLSDARVSRIQQFGDKWYNITQTYNEINLEYSLEIGIMTDDGFASLFLVIDKDNNLVWKSIVPTVYIPSYLMISQNNNYFAIFTPMTKITEGKIEVFNRAGNKISKKDDIRIGLGESSILTDDGKIVTVLSERRIIVYDIDSLDEVRRYVMLGGVNIKALRYDENSEMIYTVQYMNGNANTHHNLAIYDLSTERREPIFTTILNPVPPEQENTVKLFVSNDGTNMSIRSGNKVFILERQGN